MHWIRGVFMTPNVRAKRAPAAWRQAREADDMPGCLAGLVACRWCSALERGVRHQRGPTLVMRCDYRQGFSKGGCYRECTPTIVVAGPSFKDFRLSTDIEERRPRFS
jgi:hypothetical protein